MLWKPEAGWHLTQQTNLDMQIVKLRQRGTGYAQCDS